LTNSSILRSQQFSPKYSVDIWAMALPKRNHNKCKVDYIIIENNMIYLIDKDNKVSSSIHIATLF
jgi:hypothetical protein